MKILYEIFTNSIIADWLVAIGTISLAAVTFFGDSYTRLRKKEETYKFKKISYDFLWYSFHSGGSDNEAVKGLTVREHINHYNVRLISNKIYLTIPCQIKAKKYLRLANRLALEFDNGKLTKPHNKIEKYRLKIFKELKKLAKQLGKKSEAQELERSFSS